MKINGVPSRTIWLEPDGWSVRILDQTVLPHAVVRLTLTTVGDAARAIKTMQVRGAPLIGVTAAYGMALAMREDPSDAALKQALKFLAEQRPTAVNLRWALSDMEGVLSPLTPKERAAAAYTRAGAMAEEDVETCRRIGVNGLRLIKELAKEKPGEPVNILTHCNAGWLACVDWGTATAPIYQAHDAGVPVHVWVDETRPRCQGSALTAFELAQHGVPYTLIADNAGGHFMQRDNVDMVIVGTDRVTACGDVANKIGTYLKALAAYDNGVPFYVALPYSTIDWSIERGADIPIEERGPDEVLHIQGRLPDGAVTSVAISADGTPARNPAFDVTPAKLVTGFITERGVCTASRDGLLSLYPEKKSVAA
jgi:methylthioribose-1-phosphate isomerase